MMGGVAQAGDTVEASSLYSPDLAPTPKAQRTWSTWDIAAIWVGMAACIPTYILASYMIRNGLGWMEALAIIFVANLIVTALLVLNGQAGAKYGLPFAVLGRAPFGVAGVHVPALVRALVACGWFGVQTWIGGLAIHAIACTLVGTPVEPGLSVDKFVAFATSWAVTLFFVWRGTESIRRLERLAAPLLLLVGLALLGWAAGQADSPTAILAQSGQLERQTAEYRDDGAVELSPLRGLEGEWKADAYRIAAPSRLESAPWRPTQAGAMIVTPEETADLRDAASGRPKSAHLVVQFRHGQSLSSPAPVAEAEAPSSKIASWLFWTTAMVGFWATMSISISDITRFGRSQLAQVAGQFLGLPGTMLLYSFVSVFVTCAALVGFDDVLTAEDAPWDPVSLVAQFDSPAVVVVAQLILFVATLTTNIAANVVAPANVFANLWPRVLSFRRGGLITGAIGVCIAPWLLLDRISDLLVFVSGFLGPVLGVMLADYYWVRSTQVSLPDLFDPNGAYAYRSGVNPVAMTALAAGVAVALIGYFVPALNWLYTASWFSGCLMSFVLYGLLMPQHEQLFRRPQPSTKPTTRVSASAGGQGSIR